MKIATLILAALAPALFAANPALDLSKQKLIILIIIYADIF